MEKIKYNRKIFNAAAKYAGLTSISQEAINEIARIVHDNINRYTNLINEGKLIEADKFRIKMDMLNMSLKEIMPQKINRIISKFNLKVNSMSNEIVKRIEQADGPLGKAKDEISNIIVNIIKQRKNEIEQGILNKRSIELNIELPFKPIIRKYSNNLSLSKQEDIQININRPKLTYNTNSFSFEPAIKNKEASIIDNNKSFTIGSNNKNSKAEKYDYKVSNEIDNSFEIKPNKQNRKPSISYINEQSFAFEPDIQNNRDTISQTGKSVKSRTIKTPTKSSYNTIEDSEEKINFQSPYPQSPTKPDQYKSMKPVDRRNVTINTYISKALLKESSDHDHSKTYNILVEYFSKLTPNSINEIKSNSQPKTKGTSQEEFKQYIDLIDLNTNLNKLPSKKYLTFEIPKGAYYKDYIFPTLKDDIHRFKLLYFLYVLNKSDTSITSAINKSQVLKTINDVYIEKRFEELELTIQLSHNKRTNKLEDKKRNTKQDKSDDESEINDLEATKQDETVIKFRKLKEIITNNKIETIDELKSKTDVITPDHIKRYKQKYNITEISPYDGLPAFENLLTHDKDSHIREKIEFIGYFYDYINDITILTATKGIDYFISEWYYFVLCAVYAEYISAMISILGDEIKLTKDQFSSNTKESIINEVKITNGITKKDLVKTVCCMNVIAKVKKTEDFIEMASKAAKVKPYGTLYNISQLTDSTITNNQLISGNGFINLKHDDYGWTVSDVPYDVFFKTGLPSDEFPTTLFGINSNTVTNSKEASESNEVNSKNLGKKRIAPTVINSNAQGKEKLTNEFLKNKIKYS